MAVITFPRLRPPAIDSRDLRPPVRINERDVTPVVEFPEGGGTTRWVMTEANAGCRHINMGIFEAEPGKGSQWHAHPEEAEEEEFIWVLSGEGTMVYKQGGRDHELPFRTGDSIFTGHLTHLVRNTGTAPLKLCFSISPLPMRTIIHGVKNDDGKGYRDSVNLNPPRLVHEDDVPVTGFTTGGILNRKTLFPDVVGSRHGRLAKAWEAPGKGSFWHTHPQEVEEEDLFYTYSGQGTMVYVQEGEVHTFVFGPGDAIHSHHLTNYTTNHTDQDLLMVTTGAPNPVRTLVHEAE